MATKARQRGQDAADGPDEVIPATALLSERGPTGAGQGVHTSAASQRLHPVTAEQPSPLKPMQSGVDGARGKVDGARAADAERLDDGVPMQRSGLKYGQYEAVKVTFQCLRPHA